MTDRAGSGRSDVDVRPFPRSRRLIVDIGRVTRSRPSVNGFVEADVTDVRRRLRAQRDASGTAPSLTAFVVRCVGEAVSAHPQVHGLRDLRGNVVVFDCVDVNVSIEVELEGGSFPMNHVVRRADRRSVADIGDELHGVKRQPDQSPTARMVGPARWFLRLPGPVRRTAFRALYRLPRQQRALAGTVGVTAIGMVGRGGGWGTAFQVHPVEVVVGGISRRPGLVGDDVVSREYLHLTLSFDHDVVDGAPAARFTTDLRALIEAPDRVLPAPDGVASPRTLGAPGTGATPTTADAAARDANADTRDADPPTAAVWPGDARPGTPTVGDERQVLCAFLDWHRDTFALKCAGVPTASLSRRTVAPSSLSLHGLARHLADVERWWFRMQFSGEDITLRYSTPAAPDGDFDDLHGDPAEALEAWRAECERSRQVVAAARSLDETGTRRSDGRPVALRWVLMHVITEYARHNGHADLLRERIDGATGM